MSLGTSICQNEAEMIGNYLCVGLCIYIHIRTILETLIHIHPPPGNEKKQIKRSIARTLRQNDDEKEV